MKIAILTQPLWFNYGGILQNFALQTTLKDMGHEVYTLNIIPDLKYTLSFSHLCGYFYRLFQRYILQKKSVKVSWNPGVSFETYMYISQNTLKFVNKNITLTDAVHRSQLESIARKYSFDAYVVGSDQVWIPSYYPDSFIPFDNRQSVRKIFYAASSGHKSWLDVESIRTNAIELLKTFDGVSVRESSLKEKLSRYTNIKCIHVLDPTLLLCSSDYLKIYNASERLNPHIFAYILDKNLFKQEIIRSVSTQLKLDVLYGTPDLSYQDVNQNNIDGAVYDSVEKWINGFSTANFIITDSFHGTVFSIIFQKQFVVIANQERGLERFESLLSSFGLKDRIITSVSQVNEKLASIIDFSKIDPILNKHRAHSLKFLKDSLTL